MRIQKDMKKNVSQKTPSKKTPSEYEMAFLIIFLLTIAFLNFLDKDGVFNDGF